MELVDSLDEMFEWQTSFCSTLLNDVTSSEGTITSLDALLVDIELPEINLGPGGRATPASHPNPLSLSLSPPNPVSISLSPSHSGRTIPVVTSAIQAPANTRDPLAVNPKPCSVQTGTRGFEIPTSTTPMSSAPNTPPVVKPKGSRGRGTAKPKCPPKKRKSPQELGLHAAGPKSKENRVPTTAEHIIRERQRRDDMSAKYLILESLLPPASKRERAVVVEDAISFVGALQRKKAELLSRRSDLKLMASYNQLTWCKKMRSIAHLRRPSGNVVDPSHCIMTKQRSAPENCKSESPLSGSSDGVRADPSIVTIAGTISAIHVHIGEEEVVVEMVWNRPRPNFQSVLLEAVESLGFDVTQCSIFRVGNEYIQCVATCSKSQVLPQRISEIQSSSTLIIRALTNMLTQI